MEEWTLQGCISGFEDNFIQVGPDLTKSLAIQMNAGQVKRLRQVYIDKSHFAR